MSIANFRHSGPEQGPRARLHNAIISEKRATDTLRRIRPRLCLWVPVSPEPVIGPAKGRPRWAPGMTDNSITLTACRVVESGRPLKLFWKSLGRFVAWRSSSSE
jgi:hypothetical protein